MILTRLVLLVMAVFLVLFTVRYFLMRRR